MNASFQLDGCYSLEVGDNLPRDFRSPNSVGLQVTHHPLPVMQESSPMTYPPTVYRVLSDVRDGRIVFYGPHPCATCGCLIVKASQEDGGQEFDQPEGPLYPNTQWVPHVHRQAPAPRDEVVFAACLPPSHARAIASAILAAATEARK